MRQVNGWHLSESADCSAKDFSGFPIFLQENVGIAPEPDLFAHFLPSKFLANSTTFRRRMVKCTNSVVK